MSKPIIVDGPLAAVAVSAKEFLKQDGSGALTSNDGVATAVGIAISNADNSATPDEKFANENVGVLKQGLIKVATVNAAYEWGDTLELASGGQSVQAETTNPVVATACETKTTTSGDNELLVYVNFA